MTRMRAHGARIIVITPSSSIPYSGMLPGWVAGHYDIEQFRIDVQAVVRAAGGEIIHAEACAIDAAKGRVCLKDGQTVGYDLLSVNIGGDAERSWLEALGTRLLCVRPLNSFVEAWPRVIESARGQAGFRLAVVGAGAAGMELAMAAGHAFAARRIDVHISLIASERGCVSGFSEGVRRRAKERIAAAGIVSHDSVAVGFDNCLLLADGTVLGVDCAVAATGTRAPAWLGSSGLALDTDGYIAVDPCHRSISHPNVFAVGDVCARTDVAMARSGVHAVHAGEILGRNLVAALQGAAVKPYRPRRRSLYLLSCGGRYAIASWGRWSAEGHWVWRWKDRIDRGFVEVFRRLGDNT